MNLSFFLRLSTLSVLLVLPMPAQSTWPGRDRLQPEQCTPMTGDAAAWLRRADSTTGLSTLGDRVLSFRATETNALLEQSDRAYPPFIMMASERQWWFGGERGIERFGPVGAVRTRDQGRTEWATAVFRDTAATLIPQLNGTRNPQRALNPLAVLRDWAISPGITVVSRCTFRDYPRIVLERREPRERLYLDEKSAVPVKLDREESHYLWGQVHAEYVYSTWWRAGSLILPLETGSFIDGILQINRTLAQNPSDVGIVMPRDSAPSLRLPADIPTAARATAPAPVTVVDTVRIGANTYLLVNPAYTQTVTLARDTVFMLDATMGEARGRADSAWIAKLFPGRHPMVVVVTDIAWPHVAGLRYWVARGATVVTHAASRGFLDQVLARKWTRTPDAFELARARLHPVIRTTRGPLDLAGGAVQLRPIDGISSEGALMALLPADQFLWASDYIQSVSSPTIYAREVFDAVHRAGFAPNRVAAEHLPLTPWTSVEAIVRPR